MSEIIHYVDSEITAETAVVKEFGSPKGCGTLSLLPQAAISLARQSQFRSAKAEFHSRHRREFHFALQSEHLPDKFPLIGIKGLEEQGKLWLDRGAYLCACLHAGEHPGGGGMPQEIDGEDGENPSLCRNRVAVIEEGC